MEASERLSGRKQSAARWKEHIKTQKASGQSVKEWCTANEVSLKQFYHWRKKLEGTADELPCSTQQIVKVPQEAMEQRKGIVEDIDSMSKAPMNKTEPTIPDKSNKGSIVRIYAAGYEIEVPTAVSENELEKIMRAMKNAW